MTNNKSKNISIQFLRVVAISAVLGFHLCPNKVPQGFLGVDIFFVISGYLMTSILDGRFITFKTCINFYERRFKRILPAYLFMISSTLTISSICLTSVDFEFLKVDALWAITLTSNIQSIFDKNAYFKLVSEYKLLLHTWSLSVELQYYLMAPFIIILITYNNRPLLLSFCLILMSYLFHALIPSQSLSFGFLFSRIWQFIFGTLSYLFYKFNILIFPAKYLYFIQNLNVLFILVVCFMPKLSETFIYDICIRLIVIILSFFAIYISQRLNETLNLAKLSKIIIYFGDISYSLYLIHWPIIILVKYLEYQISLHFLIIIILLISIFQYHWFERPLLFQPSKAVFAIVILLFFYIVAYLLFSSKYMSVSLDPININQNIAKNCVNYSMDGDCPKNSIMGDFDFDNIPHIGYFCSYEGNGNVTVLVTGNSYALHQFDAIKKAL